MADEDGGSSRLLPGAKLANVMWSLEGPKFNIMSNFEDIPRGEMAGYNARVIGNVRELFPRMSHRDYEHTKLCLLPEVQGGTEALVGLLGNLSPEVRRTVAETRKVVAQTLSDGSVRYAIVPSIPQAIREVDILEHEQGYNELAEYEKPTAEELDARPKTRTYALTQIFNDMDVSNKYELPFRVIETAKRQAITSPAAAAKTLQDFMNAQQKIFKVRVTAPKGQLNKSLAATTLRTVGASYPRVDVSVESEVMMDTLIMYGPDGRDGWNVSGPLKYANEVSYAYWMMYHEGRIFPNVLFSMELVLLDINVYDGETSAEPAITFHAGEGDEVPVGLSELTKRELSVAQRLQLEGFGERMTPVLSSFGSQIATAIQVTGRHAVVNAHVMMTDPGCRLMGEQLEVKQQLSRDLLCVLLEKDAPPWVLREPREQELVTICYLSGGKISCTRPVKVVSLSNDVIVMSKDPAVGPGFSGGAVVALSDLALLGIHSAGTLQNMLAFKFGDTQFAELLDSDSVAMEAGTEEPGDFAMKTVSYLSNRGLSGVFNLAVSSLEPVYVGDRHVGTAVRSGGKLFTTCDPNLHLTFGENRRVHVLDRVPGTTSLYCARDDTGGVSPVYKRPPNYYEKVFVVGWDAEPYLSTSTEVAHIGPAHASFVLRPLDDVDRSLVGGMVMGLDGAFLGICGPHSESTAVGGGYVCWTVPDDRKMLGGPREAVSQAFPFINIQAWPDDLLTEIFTHSSVGKYDSGHLVFNAGCKPLASVGNAVLKTMFATELREVGYPHGLWAVREQEMLANSRLAEVAWKFRFAKAFSVGVGANLPRDSRAYSELTEALIGAASLVENAGVVKELVAVMGLVSRPDGTPKAPATSYFELPRTGTAIHLATPDTPAID